MIEISILIYATKTEKAKTRLELCCEF